MPTYEYKAIRDGCDKCRIVFEVRQSIRSKPMKTCPDCGAPIQRVIGNVIHYSPRPKFSYDRAADAGFTAYERSPKGLKKVAGDGPEMPVADDRIKDLG